MVRALCPKNVVIFGHRLVSVRKMYHISDMATLAHDANLRSRVLARIASSPNEVWTPSDFADLGSRAAVDKTLQRLAAAGDLRRIDRGLYDVPRKNELTGHPTVPDYRAVIRAVTRRDQARAVLDGMTAANDLGLTTAVPARIEVLVDARLKPIKLGKQEIHFKFAAPSRLYWAGRPAMRIVQALHWMQDMLAQDETNAPASRPRCAAFSATRSTGRRSANHAPVSPRFRSSSCETCSAQPMRTRASHDQLRIQAGHRRAAG